MKYKIWLAEWLENYVVPTAKSKTRERYTEIVEKHVCPKLGGYELEDLTPIVLQRYVTEKIRSGNLVTGQGLSSNSVNCIITVIQNSLKSAYVCGKLKEYVADKIQRPKKTEKGVSCFTLQEQKRIEQAALASKNPNLTGIVLCLYSGLRIGELLALSWSDVDFLKRTISVERACHDGKDADGNFGRVVEAPKTPSSRRVIPIAKQILPLLRKLKKCQKGEYVFCTKKGNALSVRSYQDAFARLLKRLGIAHKGFHALRHTFATRALECNMDVKTLSEILGHKNASVTLNRYVHSMMEHKAEMMNKIGKLL